MGHRFHWQFFLIALLAYTSYSPAQELRIGHLETLDDIGINWLFFHCNQSGDVLNCSIFQTLVIHQTPASTREAELRKQMEESPADFVRDFADLCKNGDKARAGLDALARNGKGPDGRNVSAAQIARYKVFVESALAMCRNPNKDNQRRTAEIIVDQKIATCSVVNDFSEATFKWNAETRAWNSQTGPAGPCGRITIGTLEKDPESKLQFWKYTERAISTRPDGELLGGAKCSQFPDRTFHYTWRASENLSECWIIKNLMN